MPANLRPVVYRYGFGAVGGAHEWDVMWRRYENATTAQEKLYILSALSDSRDVWLIERCVCVCVRVCERFRVFTLAGLRQNFDARASKST